jgi:signal transduction histidine kinase
METNDKGGGGVHLDSDKPRSRTDPAAAGGATPAPFVIASRMTRGKSKRGMNVTPDARLGPRSFAVRLAGAFVVLLVVLGGTAVVSVRQLAGSANERETLERQFLEGVVYAERLRSASDAESAASRGYLITGDAEFLRQFEEEKITFDRAVADLRSRVFSQAGSELLERVVRASADYKRANQRILLDKRERAEQSTIVARFEHEVVPTRNQLNEAIDDFVAYKEKRLESGYQEGRSLTSAAVSTSTGVLVLALIASGALAWATGRHLARAHRHKEDAVRATEQAVAARDRIVGVVAHDLRSPLSAIMLKAESLRRALPEDRPRKQADSILAVAKRMEDLITSLLDAASIDSGGFAVMRASCDVQEILDATMEVLSGVASSKSVRLEYRLGQAGLTVMADRDRIVQVLTNLIGNAVKFTFEGGRVDVAAESIAGDLRVSVSDSGPGIAPKHLPHIFERFWRADTGDKRGTGLGLYIAKAIVEAHGGRIWVDSQLGHGATFRFTLPLIAGPGRSADRTTEGATASPAQ